MACAALCGYIRHHGKIRCAEGGGGKYMEILCMYMCESALSCHVKPGCGVTMLVTVAVRALESFRLVKRRFVSRFKLVAELVPESISRG